MPEQDEIKAAWRAVAKAVHPDQNKDDPLATQRFAEAGRAYEVLKDPKLRNRYDYARREAELRRMEEMKRKSRGATGGRNRRSGNGRGDDFADLRR